MMGNTTKTITFHGEETEVIGRYKEHMEGQIAAIRAELAAERQKREEAEATTATFQKVIRNADDDIIQLRATVEQQAAVIEQMQSLIRKLVEATPGSLGRCSGYKCREPYCVSCFEEEEAEEYLQGVFDLCAEANKALALQPSPDILRQRDERIKEQCARVCEDLAKSHKRDTDGECEESCDIVASFETCAAAIRAMEVK